jgi:2-amino-4-hydroxy-6-hydroxymethyldihydropteridine diphosphokinase
MMLEAVARGELPAWSEVKAKRRAHIERVAAQMAIWAEALELDAAEKTRWLAAAWLHDALRDARPESLRPAVDKEFADWPLPLLHGPAAAARTRAEGVTDEPLLRAIAYHTVGHPGFDACGRALFLADYLEPGRTFDPVGRAVLRARMPHDESAVLRDVLRNRMAHLITSHKKIRRETVAFWNTTAG